MSYDKDIEMTTRDHGNGNVNGPEYRDKPDPVLGYAGGDRHVSASGMPRYITSFATLNFTYVILSSWEAFAISFQFSLYNGGPDSLSWGCLLVMVGGTCIALSLAELASIDPAVGAQYRWTASLAPKYGKFFGLFQGWITVLAWIMACAGPPAFIANIITSLVSFNYPDYHYHNWHTMLIMWGFIIVPYVLNLWVQKTLNIFEVLGGILHLLFFVTSIIVLWTLASRSTNDFVWDTLFVGLSGWSNPGVNFSLGIVPVAFGILGFDGVLHMSEEVTNVAKAVPRSIIISAVINSGMLFIFVITLLYCIGDIDVVSSEQYASLPIIAVYYLATKSHAGTTVLTLFILIIFVVVLFNAFASVSRLTWAFARDRGLPFSDFWAKVSPNRGFPVNALGLIAAVSFLISILYVISPTAFNAVISLQALGFVVSYVLPIAFVTIRKLTNNPPPYGPWRMGKWWGLPVNIFALIYLIYLTIFIPFPTVLPITGKYFNYAGPLVGAVMLGAVIDFAINGRKRFTVPTHGKLAEHQHSSHSE